MMSTATGNLWPTDAATKYKSTTDVLKNSTELLEKESRQNALQHCDEKYENVVI